MIITITTTLLIIFIIYPLIAYIKRKIAKPNYQNKIIWITGASSGIGQYLAYQFNKLGGYVILSARNQKQLNKVKNNCKFPQKAQILKMDMTNYSEVKDITKKLIQKLQSKNQKIDVVVQNAGISMRCQFVQFPFQNHVSLFNVNVHGPYNHLQCVVPHLIKHKSGQIVGISSQAGKLGTAYRSSYAGSKHAFIGIMDSLRTQLQPYGVKVCNIMPGYIKTKISMNAMGAQEGKAFGKTDTNIETGMQPQVFAKQAVNSIFNKQNQVSIAKGWTPIIGIVLRNICPDLIFKFLVFNAKNQSKAVKQAKKQ